MSPAARTMKTKPTVGQTLYSLNIGNSARHRPAELTPVTVRSVGRKYFACSSDEYPTNLTQFHCDDWREKTEYGKNQSLYASKQEWLDEKESSRIHDEIVKAFDRWTGRRFPLSTLRQIHALIQPEARL